MAGYEALASELAPLAVEAHALNSRPLIDRDAVYRLKLTALEKLWRAFSGDERFKRFVGERGRPLAQFAAYCTLAETLGANWHDWDVAYHDPGSPAVRDWATRRADRCRFFQWIQWLLDVQLAGAAERLLLVGDLPIGASPDGFDAWAWQGCLGRNVAMGAPPDLFNTQGQNWGLPPFVPHKLMLARYEPFVDIVRAALRHAGGLRIDHVIGLFRSFWIPYGFAAAEGDFVRYPVDDLLAILVLESQRAGAVIIGEDLGTVEPGVREKLAAHDILSYALLYFERGQPAGYPPKSLASVSTHDLPTLAGLCSGSDLVEQQRLSLGPSTAEERSLREHLQALAGLTPDASIDEVILKVHAALAPARSMLVAASLEDALCVAQRPNIPNTTTGQRPNWSRARPRAPRRFRQAAANRRAGTSAIRPWAGNRPGLSGPVAGAMQFPAAATTPAIRSGAVRGETTRRRCAERQRRQRPQPFGHRRGVRLGEHFHVRGRNFMHVDGSVDPRGPAQRRVGRGVAGPIPPGAGSEQVDGASIHPGLVGAQRPEMDHGHLTHRRGAVQAQNCVFRMVTQTATPEPGGQQPAANGNVARQRPPSSPFQSLQAC